MSSFPWPTLNILNKLCSVTNRPDHTIGAVCYTNQIKSIKHIVERFKEADTVAGAVVEYHHSAAVVFGDEICLVGDRFKIVVGNEGLFFCIVKVGRLCCVIPVACIAVPVDVEVYQLGIMNV